MSQRNKLGASQRWVIKIGSSLITNAGRGLDSKAIAHWAQQIAELRQQGKELVLVSSGAVAEGMARLGWNKRPHELHKLQAAAALGQMGLVQGFESCFKQHGILTAQVLLTHDDLGNRSRYLNARSTLTTLLELGAIPIINENDTVATEEIRLGDNDTLAALVSNLVEADLMVLLTDQKGLYSADPRNNQNAELISETDASNPELIAMAGDGGVLGRGGMRTKVRAAQRAARSGASTLIASGSEDNVLLKIAAGENLGSLLLAKAEPITARKQWLANQLNLCGTLHLDAGASQALLRASSLLAVGVSQVNGHFKRGDLVSCVAADGKEIARGLVNYSAEEANRIKGLGSDKIEAVLGYIDEPELIHRDNLVLV
jgi:glutamate 5-kinase